jgi:hypothetical protein
MTDIKLTLDDPAEFARWLHAHAGQMPETWSARACQLDAIAHQIEEQVNPVVDEPTEPWSVIKARPSWRDADPREFTLLRGGFWVDHDGNECGAFSTFTDVEVLRVGIGEDLDAPWRAQQQLCNTILTRLREFHANAITAERKGGLQRAIEFVEGLKP